MWFGYLILLLAIISENIGTTSLKGSNGLTRPLLTIGAFAGYILNFLLMGQALNRIPLAIAYGIWSGLGMAIVSLLGVLIYKETFNWRMAIGLSLVIIGLVIMSAT
ncbi:multidrug efflux SMR transporter [Synechococcus sp. UW179B]|jgi:small multidrug resistance pump|uniref:DMT family transporter n=1 Tax=Synechococcus sp. UW179B TaxID=2575516 RepID=UPI000E0E88AC|nr:multidrug efflux SMR transporter [Synechococcus sp. UW179B]